MSYHGYKMLLEDKYVQKGLLLELIEYLVKIQETRTLVNTKYETPIVSASKLNSKQLVLFRVTDGKH